MRILTFNWHEAYLCTLAKTGHRFDVVERDKGGSRIWFYQTRPLPTNIRVVRESRAVKNLRRRSYDLVICHNPTDLRMVLEFAVPKVLVFHNRLTTEIALWEHTVDLEAYRCEVRDLIEQADNLQVVFISQTKRADWGLAGEVIPPGIDLNDYGGYHGRDPVVLRVGNFMKRRDLMMGYSTQEALLQGIPSTLLGLNEPDEHARFTDSWDDLKTCYRSHRLYLNTTVDGYEDGYNLSMLEAMATGMPVVSTPNVTSPLVHGVNGYVSADLSELTGRIRELLADRERAAELGQRARETVARVFPLDHFVARWNEVCQRASPVACGGRAAWIPQTVMSAPVQTRRKVLMACVSCPGTAAWYLERSLRKSHDVITVGPAVTPLSVKAWNLAGLREPIQPQDIPCSPDVDMARVVDRLPAGWKPDLFLWVDSVPGYQPRNIPRLECPTACYLIDLHLDLSWRMRWAGHFDWVFVAQRNYIGDFRHAGCARVRWLPLACDPEIHGRVPLTKRHDIGFVGSLNQVRRGALLQRLSQRFAVHVERTFLRDMARTHSASKVVFNHAANNRLNMRVFEALASGSMLLTDRTPSSGLDELFIDRQHLVLYDDESAEDLAAQYLDDHDGREAIAARGREEVLRWHTYDHRVRSLIETVLEEQAGPTVDEPQIGWPEDPLVQDIIRLAETGRLEEVLPKLGLTSGRDCAGRDLAELHNAVARLFLKLDHPEQARRHHLQAMRALPPEDRVAYLHHATA